MECLSVAQYHVNELDFTGPDWCWSLIAFCCLGLRTSLNTRICEYRRSTDGGVLSCYTGLSPDCSKPSATLPPHRRAQPAPCAGQMHPPHRPSCSVPAPWAHVIHNPLLLVHDTVARHSNVRHELEAETLKPRRAAAAWVGMEKASKYPSIWRLVHWRRTTVWGFGSSYKWGVSGP